MLAFSDTRFNLAAAGEVRYVEGLWVSGTFFDTLGVPPLLGRLISPRRRSHRAAAPTRLP